MRKNIFLILTLTLLLGTLLISGCAKQQYVPQTADPVSSATDLIDLEPKQEEVVVDIEIDSEELLKDSEEEPVKIETPVLDKRIVALKKATEKVQSYEFFYRGVNEGKYANVLSKMSHFFVYKNAVKIIIPKKQNYFPEDVFNIVYLDKANKKAYGYCTDFKYCAKMDSLRELNYDDYNIELPLELTKNIEFASYVKKQQIELSKDSIVVEYFEGKSGEDKVWLWIYEYNGAVLQKETFKQDGKVITIDFDEMLFNKVNKEDVYPPKDVLPPGFGNQIIPDEEKSNTDTSSTEIQTTQTQLSDTAGVNKDCVTIQGLMRVSEDTKICPGTYTLRQGISISESNVTLDCNGATIQGSPHDYLDKDIVGVNFRSDSRGVKLINCVIKDFGIGVKLTTDSNFLFNNTITKNSVGVLMEQLDYPYYVDFEIKENELLKNRIFDNDRQVGVDDQTYDIYADELRDVIANENYWGEDLKDGCKYIRFFDKAHVEIYDKGRISTKKMIITTTSYEDIEMTKKKICPIE
ncbi:hypothetical protein HN587_07185 [Candidatus Woesearchaeota archaeon]|jgi:hypothetical protein|nr:hypothetical protein [Candidatus Woesearchaeota archaeon]